MAASKKEKTKYLALDFDGTLVTHEYPLIGRELPNMLNVLQQLMENGHKLVLNTMRSGPQLAEAVDWCSNKGIKLFGINSNPAQKSWTSSPKVYAHLYIDDAALGTKLEFHTDGSRPSVDWFWVEEELRSYGLI